MSNMAEFGQSWLNPESMKVLETAAIVSHKLKIPVIDRSAIFLGLHTEGYLDGIFRYSDGLIKFLSAYRMIFGEHPVSRPEHLLFDISGKNSLIQASDRALYKHAGIVRPEDLAYGALNPGGVPASLIESLGSGANALRPKLEESPLLTWVLSGAIQMIGQSVGMPKRFVPTDQVLDNGIALPRDSRVILARLPAELRS